MPDLKNIEKVSNSLPRLLTWGCDLLPYPYRHISNQKAVPICFIPGRHGLVAVALQHRVRRFPPDFPLLLGLLLGLLLLLLLLRRNHPSDTPRRSTTSKPPDNVRPALPLPRSPPLTPCSASALESNTILGICDPSFVNVSCTNLAPPAPNKLDH